MITLTKTSSRLSKRLTWRSDKDSEEEKERRRKEKEWQAFAPRQHHWLRMSKEREMMAGFEWKWKNSADGYVAFVSFPCYCCWFAVRLLGKLLTFRDSGRPNSIYSGISPCTSRPGSRDGRDLRKAPSNGDLNGGGREEGAVGGPAADE